MIIMIAASLSITTSGVTRADTDQDRIGAEAAAYAGVAEYQSRLSNDSTYQKFGNPASVFTVATGSRVSLPTGALTNPAFGLSASGSWADVPTGDATVPPTASFRYEVDNSSYDRSGVVKIRSTGRVGNVTRTVVADLKQEGFINFLFLTDFETADPDLAGGTNCARYLWATPTRGTDCDTINFLAVDTFNGPVHSNDQMTVCGSTFNGAVTSSSTKRPNYTRPSGCGSARGQFGSGPLYHSVVPMPPTNAEMKKETRNDLSDDVPRPGCLYTGPTTITLLASGKMNVVSPYTKFTRTASTKAGASKPAECGTPGTASGSLGSVGGAEINVLDYNLIFVQNVPTASSDPNYWGTADPQNFTCNNRGSSSEGWSFGSGSTFTRYPLTNETIPSTSASDAPAYGCKDGDAYVKGQLDGALTIAAENYVYVTGNITYVDTAESILGLVGNNAVWVWNPMNGSTSLIGDRGRTINAALLSVAHTFMVQNHDKGSSNRGTLTINGAIAQKYRGTVSTSASGATSPSTGYAKNYNYDKRLLVTAPPKFLSPVSTTYGVTQFANVPAAFKPDGS
ncbi:hypothetical protein [Conyzicola nivalis]|nr:hypothetical protein [Conyzicola nivalis]